MSLHGVAWKGWWAILPLVASACAVQPQRLGQPTATQPVGAGPVLPLPQGCDFASAGSFALFMHQGSPFTETEVEANGRKLATSLLVDTGWNGCSTVNSSLAAELGLTQIDSPICLAAGYAGVTIGPWRGYQVVHVDKKADTLPNHPAQAGIIAAGTLVEQMIEFDLGTDGTSGNLNVFAHVNGCIQPRSQLDACWPRWAALQMDELPLRFYSSCGSKWAEENKLPGTKELRPVVPTLSTKVAGIEVLLQLDTGRDASNGLVDVSVNDEMARLVAEKIPLRQKFPDRPADRPGCTEAFRESADPARPIELVLGRKVISLEQIVIRKGAGCQPPYTWNEPAGLIGMSVLGQARRLVLDPHSGTLLIQWRSL
jgi:hypothetical protein